MLTSPMIRPCTSADLAALQQVTAGHARAHHEECFALQERGDGTYLLAWDGRVNVGMATLLRTSKYPQTQGPAEVNALEASPQGRGTGTALLQAAEREARAWGRSRIGLACEAGNTRALRLYQHLGYKRVPGLRVLDVWTEHDTGVVHEDPCLYLVKPLS
jgi:GNAT superfamily N-acetyltransferase